MASQRITGRAGMSRAIAVFCRRASSVMSDSLHKIHGLLADKAPVRWLFCGDSITHGFRHTWGHRDYTQHFAERVRSEMWRRRDIIINSAISGNTSREVLADFEWRVLQFRPHVVFLMIGMNDCAQSRKMSVREFTSNLGEFARRVQEDAGSLLVLQTSPPIIKGTTPDREGTFPEFMDAVRSVAKSHGAVLVDHAEHWDRLAEKHALWMSDSYHPGPYGHVVLARSIFDRLGIHDPESNTGRLFVP